VRWNICRDFLACRLRAALASTFDNGHFRSNARCGSFHAN
jgi:hypothetical protein